MQASTSGIAQSSDLFIVLEPFRTGFADFVRALEPLGTSGTDGPLLGHSDVYYRADTDIALLTIRFDREAITPQKLAWLTSVAARADLPVLDPARLGFSDRKAFYEDYLPNYRVRVEARGGPQEALEELARLLALPDAPPMRPTSSPSKMIPIHEESPARGSHPSTPPAAAEPNGRYGAAATVGRGPGARAATRRSTSGHPIASDRIGPNAADRLGPSAAGTSVTSPGITSASRPTSPRELESAARGPRSRRRLGPALTSPDAPRVVTPDDSRPGPDSKARDSKPSLARDGKARAPTDRGGLGRASTDREGAGRTGTDREGAGRTGIDRDGAGRAGIDREGAGRASIDREGAGRAGIDRDGAGRASTDRDPIRDSHAFDRLADAPRPAATGPAVYPVSRDRLSMPPVSEMAPVSPPARSARSAPTGPPAPVPPPLLPIGQPLVPMPDPVPEPAVLAAARAAAIASAPPPLAPVVLPGAGITEEPPIAGEPARAKQPAMIVDEDAPALQVRFLRGDHWSPARLRALSLQGARLASAAPPRAGDMVQIALGLDHLDVMVKGEVTQVTTAAQAAVSGDPSGFSLHFTPLEAPARGKLVSLLKRAKQAGISLRPPPPRASVRFPVRWPAGVITSWGELNTAALDVSRSGLFLASGTAIGAREIIFHLPMDTTGRALSGRALVAREVSEDMAAARGLTRGYGVRILDFTRNDAQRYDAFLDRIRVRTEKRILIAARRERGTELGRGLIAAGYAVHSGSDLDALTEAVANGPAPDAALIDAGLLASDPNAGALKRVLNSHNVPCLTIGNEQPERARAVVDHLLQIT